MGTPIELRIGGLTYRVLASADAAELRRLAQVVDERLRSLTAPGKQISQQTLVLAAIALAHDLEQERALRQQVQLRSSEMLRTLLARVENAIEADRQASQESGDDASPPS